MENLRSAWFGLDMRRRLIVAVAALAAFAAVLMLARQSSPRDMSLLYAGLDGAAAGGVITALEQRSTAFEVRGDAIYVPAADRDALRMALAGEGLPAGSSQGYELLDSLSGFGTTSQMFDAAYWRAKEGELARTILAVPGVRAARVHISTPTNRPFQRDIVPTAAVTVTMGSGSMSADQAQALRFLVAAAVSGMSPSDVAVIDGEGGLIGSEDPDAMGNAHAEELRARAERLLAARVGYGNAVVEISVETVTDSEQIIERRFDPEGRVAVSTEVEERTDSAQDTGGGAVTVASNLPDGEGAQDGGSSSEEASTRTLTNYELSETSRELVRVPGAVRRLTVAVLVNDVTITAADGTMTTQPRSEAELTTLGELVSSAVGLDTARGDVITVKSMSFDATPLPGTDAVAGAAASALDIMSLIRLGVMALVALVLGLFVVRPILTSAARPALSEVDQRAIALPDYSRAASDLATGLPGPGGTANIGRIAMGGLDLAALDEAEVVDPVTRLRRLIESRQDETIQILQSWIEEPEPRERA